VQALSPISVSRPPLSSDGAGRGPRLPREIIARARQEKPGQHVARVVMPFNDKAAFLIMFSASSPTPAGSELSSVYVDQYSGEVLAAPPAARTAGDIVMAWVTPLHVGGFGGAPVRWLWFVLGLAPPLLFFSGSVIWWTRVVRPGRG